MSCSCCNNALNSGLLHKHDATSRKEYKSCPHCSAAHGSEHIFHPYPEQFGKTPARVTPNNPEGDQSYCIDCRALEKGEPSTTFRNGRTCSTLI